MKRKEIEQNTIALALTGSQAYGLATPESDFDYKGIFIADQSYYFGFKTIEQKDSGWDDPHDPGSNLDHFVKIGNPKDLVLYELRKFLTLSLENNPNILEMLFFNDDFYVYKSPLFQEIIDNRHLILSKKVKHSLSGYAYSQLRRVETHRKWLLDPPTSEPRASDFGLTPDTILSKEQKNAFFSYLYILMKDRIEWESETEELKNLLNKVDFNGILIHHILPEETYPFVQQITNATDNFMKRLNATQKYRAALKAYKAYQDWIKNRNPKRAKLEAKCGFDGKHASHALRLLAMGVEALEDHFLYPCRTGRDADFLIAVKKGDVNYEEVMKISNGLFEKMNKTYESSTLRYYADREAIDELCVRLSKQYLMN